MPFEEFRCRLEKKIEAILLHKITGNPIAPEQQGMKHQHKFWVTVDHILVIDSAKTLPFFRNLDINDQVRIRK